jgi:hypothetical protein
VSGEPAYYTVQGGGPDAVDIHDYGRQYRARRLFRARQCRGRICASRSGARRNHNCAEVCQNQMEMHAAVADTTPSATA